MAKSCALIERVQPILHRVPCSIETLPNAPKHYEMLQNKSLVPMGWIGCVHCEKLWCDFVARTSSLIALVLSVLHQVSCSNKTNPKCTQIVRNKLILEFKVQWGGSGAFVAKNFWCDFIAQTCPLIAPVQPILHRVSCSYEMIPNAPKHYETHRNMSLGSNRVDQVCLLGKITTWLRGTNFCINCTCSVCLAPSFMQLRNDPKCTQILRNIPKHYFRVQLGGLGLSIAKNPDITSWHEFFH